MHARWMVQAMQGFFFAAFGGPDDIIALGEGPGCGETN